MSATTWRLPQDVLLDRRGVPALESLTDSVEAAAAMRDQGVRQSDFEARARGCWGLVARGSASLPWVEAALASGDARAISDAAGILGWVGVPPAWRPRLLALRATLAPGEAHDALSLILPAEPSPQPPPPQTALLLDGQWEPFTNEITYLEASLDEAIRGVREGHTPDFVKRVTLKPLSGTLETLLAQLEPWAAPQWKTLAVETNSGWTALFSQGGGGVYQFDVAAQALQRRCLTTAFSPHVLRDGKIVRYGETKFVLSLGDTPIRTLRASFDSRWLWSEAGDPLPFEDTTRYRARVIAKRFDLPTLNHHCQALGIARADAAAYGPRAVLIEQDISSWPNAPRTMTRVEWQRHHR